MKCPKCGYEYQVPEDEATVILHPCPNCGEDGMKDYRMSITIEVNVRSINKIEAELDGLDIIFNGTLRDYKYKYKINSIEEI